MSMQVCEIIEEHLKANGFDGLYSDECACKLDDLIPCYSPSGSCEPGYLFNCLACRKSGSCESQQDGDCAFMVSSNRSFCEPDYSEVEQ